ncbi:MAG: hypothetical protein NTV34_19185, partial [Proteobacteria bacterium]|nr:hypothetical protein [Pseudomonadota bacterium]
MKSRELSIIAIIIIASVSFHSFSGTTLAADADTDKQSDKMDSVLDKLESRFLDKEASPLTYDEQRTKAMTPSGKPTESIKINKKEPIIGQTPNHKILNEIQLKLNEYENQVDALEADARRFKGQVIQNSTTDNYVTIEAKLKDSKTSNLRAFTSKIDGSLTFNQVDPAGMWMP